MNEYETQHHEYCDAVPIKVNRVFDSCCDKDCLNDIQVNLDCGELPHNISVVKCKSVKVCDIRMNIEPIHYNKGCYSIDLTYVFNIELYAYEKSCDSPCVLTGKALACKSCILYGGESNTKTFFGKETSISKSKPCCEVANLPVASVQVVDPIALSTKIEKVCSFDGPDSPCCYKRTVIMTLGLFSVVELSRPATILVPTYEYKIPYKKCKPESEDPCEMFDRIRFPMDEFSQSNINIATDIGECECESQ